MATVEAIGRDDIAGFFDRWYRPGRDGARGGGPPRARRGRRRRGRRVLRRRAGGRAAGAPGTAGGHGRGRASSRTTPSRPTSASGGAALDVDDDDRYALAVANQVLGGGMASRLFQEVREERGLAYAVYSHPSAYTDTGCLTIYCGTAPKRARETLAVIDGVVEGLLADGDHRRRAGRGHGLPRGLAPARPRGQRRAHGSPRSQAWRSGDAPPPSTSSSPASAPSPPTTCTACCAASSKAPASSPPSARASTNALV